MFRVHRLSLYSAFGMIGKVGRSTSLHLGFMYRPFVRPLSISGYVFNVLVPSFVSPGWYHVCLVAYLIMIVRNPISACRCSRSTLRYSVKNRYPEKLVHFKMA